jgi:hypothetical protein
MITYKKGTYLSLISIIIFRRLRRKISEAWTSKSWTSSHSRWWTTHSWHTSTETHWVVLTCKHHELELFLLHMLSDRWIFVNLVFEKSCLELIFSPIMILEYPIVSQSTDKNWHNHRILLHNVKIFLFK